MKTAELTKGSYDLNGCIIFVLKRYRSVRSGQEITKGFPSIEPRFNPSNIAAVNAMLLHLL